MLPFHMSSARSITLLTNRERYHSASRDSRSTNRSFSLLALFQKTSANHNSLTSFFSIAITRFSLTFFTLEEISFLFSHSYEKDPEIPPARHQIGTILPVPSESPAFFASFITPTSYTSASRAMISLSLQGTAR